MKSVRIKDLDSFLGRKLAEDIFQGEELLAKEGDEITEELSTALSKLSINRDYVRVAPNFPLGDSQRELIFEKLYQKVKPVMKAYSFDSEEDTHIIMDIMEIMMENIYETNTLAELDIDNLLIKKPNLFSNAIDTAVIATLLAVKSGRFQRWAIEQITLGALLHDIGLASLADKERCEIGDLPKDLILRHPCEGYKILQNNPFIPEAVKKIVLMHHVWNKPEASENVGGIFVGSYPQECQGKKIIAQNKSLSVGIVQVADAFVNFTSKTSGSSFLSKRDAINDILNRAEPVYGEAAILLATYISPYSVGDVVDLTNGKKAVIIKQTSSPLNPIVSYVGKTAEIDLRKKPFTHIKQ